MTARQEIKLESFEIGVYNLKGERVASVRLPRVFNIPVRPDLIRKAFLALRTSRLQPKGADPLAGERTTAESWGVGYGIARVPRIKGGRRAALVPMAVGGRKAHPPKVEKRIRERINRKEKKLALFSAVAATAYRVFVQMRGHKIDSVKELPIIVTDELEEISKTSDVRRVFEALGIWEDVKRARKRVRIRAGKGKMRGRRYKKPKSVLIVVGKDKGIGKAARNMVGVDVVEARNLNVELLAPGGHPGRLTVYTQSALAVLEEKLGGGSNEQ